MRKSLLKFYYVLWILSLLFLLIGFTKSDQTIDYNVHDTYYVIATIQLYIGVAVYFGIVGLLYWLFYKARKKTIRLFDILYVVFMFLGIAGLTTIPMFGLEDRYYTNTAGPSNTSAILMISLAQLVLITNFIITLFRKRKLE